MKKVIFYFSGTGNSLFVAKDIAQKTGAYLIPISRALYDSTRLSAADIIGIVFPVYYEDLPIIVRRFCENLKEIKNKYIFAVCTYGGAAGNSIMNLRRIIKDNEGVLSASYGVHMPQNSFKKPYENPDRIFTSWKKILVKISEDIKSRRKRIFYSNIIIEILIKPFLGLVKYFLKKAFVKLSGLEYDASYDELIHHVDNSFLVTERCNGCGICSKVCPVDNIMLENEKPVWLHKCETCLACYNFCPSRAISGGITPDEYYYKNPKISLEEMILKQEGNSNA